MYVGRPAPRRRARRSQRAEPRPLALQRLAAQLVAACHGLGRGHIGAICDALGAAGIDPERWSAPQIIGRLNTDMRATGLSWPDRITSPGGFLASRLRRLDWRAAGPPIEGGSAAAARPDQTAARASGPGQSAMPRPALTAEQRARIASARATIRAILAARRAATP